MRDQRVEALVRFSGSYAWLVAAQFVAASAGVATSILIASRIGPEGFGTYSLFLATVSALLIPVAWMPSAAVIYGRSDVAHTGTAARSTAAIAIVCGVALMLALIAYMFAPGPLTATYPPLAPLLPLVTIGMTIGATTSAIRGTLQARQEMRRYALLTAAVAALPAMALAAGSVVGDLDARAVVILVLSGQALAAAPFVLLLASAVPRPVLDRATLAQVGTYARSYSLAAALSVVLSYADIAILGALASAAVLGQYAIGARLYQQLLVLAELFGTVAFPLVNEQRVRGRDDLVREYLERRVPQLLAASAPLITLGALLAVAAIPLVLGDAFSGTRPVLALLMVAVLAGAWRRALSPVLTAYRLIWGSTLASVVSAVLFAAGVIVGAATLGGAGAATGAVLGQMADALVNIPLLRRHAVPYRAFPGIVAMTTGGILIASVTVVTYLPVPGLLALAAALVAHVAITRRLGIFDHGDIALARSVPLPERVRGPVAAALSIFVDGRSGTRS